MVDGTLIAHVDRRLCRRDARFAEKNRVARFYELTTTGLQILQSRTESWRDYAAAIDRVLSAD